MLNPTEQIKAFSDEKFIRNHRITAIWMSKMTDDEIIIYRKCNDQDYLSTLSTDEIVAIGEKIEESMKHHLSEDEYTEIMKLD